MGLYSGQTQAKIVRRGNQILLPPKIIILSLILKCHLPTKVPT